MAILKKQHRGSETRPNPFSGRLSDSDWLHLEVIRRYYGYKNIADMMPDWIASAFNEANSEAPDEIKTLLVEVQKDLNKMIEARMKGKSKK